MRFVCSYFQHPEPHPGWSGLADAWTYKQPCPQWDRRGVDVGSEDCLYLNVYTPKIEVSYELI